MSNLREYVVCLHNYEDLELFYQDMETPGGNLYIPNRAVDVSVRKPASRNTYYWLTDEEAQEVARDPRVMFVELSPKEQGVTFKLSLTQTSSNWDKSKTINNQQYNWGLLRATRGNQVTNWGIDGTNTVTDTIDLPYTGANVDVVIIDGHLLSTHPEFAVNSDGTGGTRFVAYNWYDLNPSVTGGAAGTYSYSSTTYNFHATHVAGIAAGNRHGWARSANIYNIGLFVADQNYIFDYVKVWHQNKPVNPATGRPNPTVVNCSFETVFDGGNLKSWSDITEVTYRGSTVSGPFTKSQLEGYGFVFDSNGQWVAPTQPSSFTQDVADLISAGAIVCFAAGNTWQKIAQIGDQDWDNTCVVGGTTIYYNRGSFAAPTANSIVVGGISDKVAEYKLFMSAAGPRIDIFTPAESVNSSWPISTNPYNNPSWYAYEPADPVLDERGSGYNFKLSGTSMASPQAAGIIAALMELNWSWTPAQAKSYLQSTAGTGQLGEVVDTTSQYNLQGASNRAIYYSVSASPPPTPAPSPTPTPPAPSPTPTPPAPSPTPTPTPTPPAPTPPPPPSWTVSLGSSSLTEGNTTSVTVKSSPAADSFFVTFNPTDQITPSITSGTTALVGSEYVLTFNITANDDSVNESNRTVILEIRTGSPSGSIVGSAIITVVENDGAAEWYAVPQEEPIPIGSNTYIMIEAIAANFGSDAIPENERSYAIEVLPAGLLTLSTTTGTVSLIGGGELEWRDFITSTGISSGTAFYTLTNFFSTAILGTGTFIVGSAPPSPSPSPTPSPTPTPTPSPPGLLILPNAVRGYAYNYTLSSAHGTGPYTYSLSSGVIPDGILLSASGVLSGTPTASTGTYLFTINSVDSLSASLLYNYSLSVSAEMAITPVVLPDAVAGAAYNETLQGLGGVPPYAFSVPTGTLPAGLSLASNGIISGIAPLTLGASNFIARITDSVGNKFDWSYAIRVVEAVLPEVTGTFFLSVNTTTINEGQEVTYTISSNGFGNGFIYWKNIGTTVGSDFTDGLNQGSIQIINDSGSITRKLSNDFRTEITESIDLRLYTVSLIGPEVASTATVTVIDTSNNPRELVSGVLIEANDYNIIQTRVEEILGIGPDGYGIAAVRSTPVATSNLITRNQWNNLLFDINRINTHTRGTSTNYTNITSATHVITTTRHVDLFTITNSVYFNEGLRYSCYPGGAYPTQFYNENGEDTTWRYGISTTTNTVWYGASDTVFRMRWLTPLLARHFFNAGGQIVWEPTFAAGQAESLSDLEWANFLTLYRANGYERYIYKREDWVTTTTTKVVTYSSGTKEIVITAEKNLSLEPDRVKFTALLRDTAMPEFLVAPEGYRLAPNNDGIVQPGNTSTYTVIPSSNYIVEGSTVTWVVTTIGIPNGTNLYWTMGGTVSTSDFTPVLPTLSGTITINNNAGSVSLVTVDDGLSEGFETAILQLRTGSPSGPIVATASTVTIAGLPVGSGTEWYTITEFNPIYEGDNVYLEITASAPTIDPEAIPVNERNWTLSLSPSGLVTASASTGTVEKISAGELEWRSFVTLTAVSRGTVAITISNITGIVATNSLTILAAPTAPADYWVISGGACVLNGFVTGGQTTYSSLAACEAALPPAPAPAPSPTPSPGSEQEL